MSVPLPSTYRTIDADGVRIRCATTATAPNPAQARTISNTPSAPWPETSCWS